MKMPRILAALAFLPLLVGACSGSGGGGSDNGGSTDWNLGGVWVGRYDVTDNPCQAEIVAAEGVVRIVQDGTSVTVIIEGVVELHGTISGDEISGSGESQGTAGYNCTVNWQMNGDILGNNHITGHGTARLSGADCWPLTNCSVGFDFELTR